VVLDWRGITPGESTRQDVINALGTPDHVGTKQFGDSRVSFYEHKVEGGVIAEFARDRVFFRSDEVVAWLEVVVADRDGTFHTVQEMIDQLGEVLDVVYWNNNYNPSSRQFDVLAGPDQLYVWSECGLVPQLDAGLLTAPWLLP
jgi:hypothetical protein